MVLAVLALPARDAVAGLTSALEALKARTKPEPLAKRVTVKLASQAAPCQGLPFAPEVAAQPAADGPRSRRIAEGHGISCRPHGFHGMTPLRLHLPQPRFVSSLSA